MGLCERVVGTRDFRDRFASGPCTALGKRALRDTYDSKSAEPGAGPFRMTLLMQKNFSETLAYVV